MGYGRIGLVSTLALLTMSFTAEVTEKLQHTVEAAVTDPLSDIPGVSVIIISKDGQELFAHSAGKRGTSSNESMTLENIFWTASCTKMVAGIAVMQLVEKGVLELDNGDQLEELVPELRDVKVVQEDGTLVEKNKKITLRMLLSHTGI
jgi:CubicO group peptidase (beta-lactamase class C family)